MDDDNVNGREYNLRSRNNKRSRSESDISNKSGSNSKNKKKKQIMVTADGYIDDGFTDGDFVFAGDMDELDNDDLFDDENMGKYIDKNNDDINNNPDNNNSENKNNNYFMLDTKKIQQDMVKRLTNNKSLNITEDEAEKVVTETFTGVSNHFIAKYAGCKVSDEHWKLGLTDNEINTIDSDVKRIRQKIEEEIPTIPKIFKANITEADKIRCTKMYDQLQNIEPYTTDHDNKVSEINNILRKSNKYTKDEIKFLESEANRLKEIAKPPDDLVDRILKLDASDNVKAIIYGQYLEMLEHETGSQAYNAIREEIEWSLQLPHNKSHKTKDLSALSNIDLNKYYINSLKALDNELYGMQDIKLKLLHIINDRRKSGDACGRNIAIVGPPGTGKTSIGKAFAKVMGLPFEVVSLGGLDDASILKGSNKMWNSSAPSIVLQILSRIKSSSGVVMFDELDKLGETSKAKEVQYTLLHISDYIHNNEFRDNYLNKYPHDFSKLLFIFGANTISTLDAALLNRLDVIETHPYTTEQKEIIGINYVLPEALSKVGLPINCIKINPKAMNKLILATKDDPGVRTIEKVIKEIVGKINMYDSVLLNDGTTGDLDLGYEIPNFKLPITITPKLLQDLTGNMVSY